MGIEFIRAEAVSPTLNDGRKATSELLLRAYSTFSSEELPGSRRTWPCRSSAPRRRKSLPRTRSCPPREPKTVSSAVILSCQWRPFEWTGRR